MLENFKFSFFFLLQFVRNFPWCTQSARLAARFGSFSAIWALRESPCFHFDKTNVFSHLFCSVLKLFCTHTFKKKDREKPKRRRGLSCPWSYRQGYSVSSTLLKDILCTLCSFGERGKEFVVFIFGRFAAADKGTTCMIYSSHRCLIWPTSVARSALTRDRDPQIQADYYWLWL